MDLGFFDFTLSTLLSCNFSVSSFFAFASATQFLGFSTFCEIEVDLFSVFLILAFLPFTAILSLSTLSFISIFPFSSFRVHFLFKDTVVAEFCCFSVSPFETSLGPTIALSFTVCLVTGAPSEDPFTASRGSWSSIFCCLIAVLPVLVGDTLLFETVVPLF